MGELEDRVEDRITWTSEVTRSLELEIEAMVGALEPVEESDAVEVLATWRHKPERP